MARWENLRSSDFDWVHRYGQAHGQTAVNLRHNVNGFIFNKIEKKTRTIAVVTEVLNRGKITVNRRDR